MDPLERFILWRIGCRIHPYIPPGERWRTYPPHMAKLLEVLEPIHVIAVTDNAVGVDGVGVGDSRSMHKKYSLAVKAVEEIFGETVEKIGIAFNTEVRMLSSGLASICFFQGSVWYLAPCVENQPYPARFAYVADPYKCFAHKDVGESHVECVAAVEGGAKARVTVSPSFYLDPKPENARLFGDLCLLAQMGDGWMVEGEVDVKVDDCDGSFWSDDMYRYIANILRDSVGLKSFVSHGCQELLLRDGSDPSARSWRKLLKLLENRRGG